MAPASGQSAADREEEIALLVESAREDLDIPGLAYVAVSNGEIIAQGAAGVADRDDGDPVDPVSTVFRVGSVSKPMTALATLLLAEQGRVDLDAPVERYVDVEFNKSSSVTVGSLLTHTAGFEANSIGLVSRSPSDVDGLVDYVTANVPERFEETGVVHSYSNYGYALAGRVIESVTGSEFFDHVEETIFAPLGMDSSSFELQLPANVASGYDGLAGSRIESVDVYLRPYPAGGAVTTADDMAELLLAMLGHRPDVVPPSVADLMVATGFRSHPEVPGRTVGGLEEMTVNGMRVFGHSGDIAGFGAQIALVPDHDIGIFFAANTVDFELNAHLLDGIIGLLVEPHSQAAPQFIELDSDELDTLAGSYRWTRYSRTDVDKILAIFPTPNFTVRSPGDGTLVVEIGGVDGQWAYRPIDELAFAKVAGERVVVDGLVVDPGERISFTRDEEGDIAYLNFSMSTISGERTPGFLMGPAQLALITGILGLHLLALLVWSVAAWRRKRRPDAAPQAARWISRLVPVHSALLLGGLIATVVGLSGPVPFGLPTAAVAGIAVLSIVSIAGLVLIPVTVITWRQQMLSVTERVTLTGLALAAPVFLWWLTYWNLFGIR